MFLMLNAMKFLSTTIQSAVKSPKKKVSSPSKNYVKESKNVYMHKVDLAPIEIKKERCT